MSELETILKFDWENNKIYADPIVEKALFFTKLEELSVLLNVPSIPGITTEVEDVYGRVDPIIMWSNMAVIIDWFSKIITKAKDLNFDVARGFKKEQVKSVKTITSKAYDRRCPVEIFDRGLVTVSKTETATDVFVAGESQSPFAPTMLTFDILGIKDELDALLKLKTQINSIKVDFKTYADLYDNTDSSEDGNKGDVTTPLALVEKESISYSIRPCLHLLNYQASIASKYELDSKVKVYDLTSNNGMESIYNAIAFRIFRSVSGPSAWLLSNHLLKWSPNTILAWVKKQKFKLPEGGEEKLLIVYDTLQRYQGISALIKNVGRLLAEQDNASTEQLVKIMCASNPITLSERYDKEVVEQTRRLYSDTKKTTDGYSVCISYKVKEIEIQNNYIEGAFATIEHKRIGLGSNNEARSDSVSIDSVQSDEVIKKTPLLRRRVRYKGNSSPIKISVKVDSEGIVTRDVDKPTDDTTTKQIKNISIKSANWEDCARIYNNMIGSYNFIGQKQKSLKLAGSQVTNDLIMKLLSSPYDFSLAYQSERYEANLDISGICSR